MFRSRIITGLAALSLVMGFLVLEEAATAVRAGETFRPGALPIERGLKQRLANFTLNDVTTGRSVTLYNLQGKKAVVIVSLGIECPMGNLYVGRLNELSREFHDKKIAFLGINSNEHETEQDIAKYVAEHHVEFPVLKDPRNLVADMALLERTCESIVVDGFGLIRYRGAIDDEFAQGRAKNAPVRHYLRDALTAVLARQDVAVPATKVAGCLIERTRANSNATAKGPRIHPAAPEIARVLAEQEKEHPVEVGKVTYASHVAKIMQDRCQTCHRPGEVGPFSLSTYDDAMKHTEMIREVVDNRRMPPWHADPRYGHFVNDRSLSAKERATLLAWVDQGSPLGDSRQLPAPRDFPEGWKIGTPDVILEMPETYYVPAQGVVAYVYTKVRTNFTEDMWIQAAEAMPGDRAVVHHIIVFVLDPKAPRGPGGRMQPMHFAAYVPGDTPSIFQEGTAKKIPAGADLLFQIHYTPVGQVRADRSKLGLVFAKTKPKREAFTVGIANSDLIIPPYRANVAAGSSWVLPAEARLLSLAPHMHVRGKDFKFTITRPGESPQVALSVPAYDFNWQIYYTLTEPMELPKGTRIDCVAHFDNSENNPYNPDPSKLVRWGEQTYEEMLIGYCDLDIAVGSPMPMPRDVLFLSTVESTFFDLTKAWKKVGHPAEPRPRPKTPRTDLPVEFEILGIDPD